MATPALFLEIRDPSVGLLRWSFSPEFRLVFFLLTHLKESKKRWHVAGKKLNRLSKDELDLHFKSLAQKERELLFEVLVALKEIDAQRVYLELGYPSLFAYLTQGVGYSHGGAQRRIDAARLLRNVPSIGPSLKTGDLKLSQLALVQKASRQVARSGEGTARRNDEILGLLESLKGAPHRETQHRVAEFFDLPVLTETRISTQADQSVRVEMTFTAEQFALLSRARELCSHSLSGGDLVDFVLYASRRLAKGRPGDSGGNGSPKATSPVALHTADVAVGRHRRPRLEAAEVDKGCAYKDPQSGRTCGSKWLLQVDHIQPQWAGGGNQLENLQLLCGPHNKMKYKNEAGIRPRS